MGSRMGWNGTGRKCKGNLHMMDFLLESVNRLFVFLYIPRQSILLLLVDLWMADYSLMRGSIEMCC